MKACSKPACGRPGAAVLAYDYAAKRASLIDPLEGRVPPHLYVLCSSCAERLTAPLGWELADERRVPPLFASEPERSLVGAGTPDVVVRRVS